MLYEECAGTVLLLMWSMCWYFFFFVYTSRGQERDVAHPVSTLSSRFRYSAYATFTCIAAWVVCMFGTDGAGVSHTHATQVIAAFGFAGVIVGQVLLVLSRRSLRFLSNREVLCTISTVKVTGGLFRYVKHPMYAGLFLALMGSSLALLNIYAAFVVLILIAPMLALRARLERGTGA